MSIPSLNIDNTWKTVLIGVFLLGLARQAAAQHDHASPDSVSNIIRFPVKANCKSYSIDSVNIDDLRLMNITFNSHAAGQAHRTSPPLVQLHGNFSYSFDYRSRLDTPFSASNFQQHHEQVYADATLKGRYPFRVEVGSRQSSSPYFPNYTDVNVEFNHPSYQRGIKEAMIAEMTKKIRETDSADQRLYRNVDAQYLADRNWLTSPARTQEIVQEKEKLYQEVIRLSEQQAKLAATKDSGTSGLPVLPGQLTGSRSHGFGSGSGLSPDSLLKLVVKRRDSLLAKMGQGNNTQKEIKEREKAADSLYKVAQAAKRRADSLARSEDSVMNAYATEVRNARSFNDLQALEKKAGTHALASGDKTLLAVDRFSVGRSAVNYSELTVKNLSVTGVNAEYSPSYYTAFVAGFADYLFRDFINQPGKMPKQDLVAGRFGWGDKDRKILIFTVYTGKKNNFGGTTTDTASTATLVSSQPIFGYSLEGIYRLGTHTQLSAEAAKSSSPSSAAPGSGSSIDHAFAFSDRNNEAFSVKLKTSIPAAQASIDLFYRKIGANFQSFSIFNNGSRQENWGIKWRQYFFKKQLSLTAELKKSNYDDPLAAAGFNSSLLFKSVQLMYRKKKWPVFTLGYMPSAQLIKPAGGQLTESIYYVLAAGAFYTYSVSQCQMSSSLLFNRFYNRGTDSGFVFYNAETVVYTHSIDLHKVRLTTDVQYTNQPQLVYWSWQQRADVTIGKHLTVGAGIKDNVVPKGGKSYWGGSLQTSLSFGKVGGLRMICSKDYLPDGGSGLVANNWGRLQWFKLF